MGSIGEPSSEDVVVEAHKFVRTLVLNRPRVLNCLNLSVVSQLADLLEQWEGDDSVSLIIIKAAGKIFSAGGDLRMFYDGKEDESWKEVVYKKYWVDYHLYTYNKDRIVIWHGLVVGGGAGFTFPSNFRIVTENAGFSTPEVRVGFHADCSASYYLPRLPGHLGEYLALTGSRLNSSEMLECGLATHFVPSKDIAELETSLLDLQPGNSIQEVIQQYSKDLEGGESSVMKRVSSINRCFSKARVEDIIESLISSNDKWCDKTAQVLKRSSPIALKQTLASIRRGRNESLKECMEREYRMTFNCLRGLVSKDFFEGTRAAVVDKDNAPKWDPQSLSLVSDEMVEIVLNTDVDEREKLLLPTGNEARWSGKHPPLKLIG